MKKIIFFSLSLFTILGFISYFGQYDNQKSNQANAAWETYSKNKDNLITNYPTTEDELHSARLTSSNQRLPQSIAEDNPVIKERTVIGNKGATQIKMSNYLNKSWKDSLGHELLRFHPEETKILIKEEDSILKIESGHGRLLEQVVVSYLQNNNMLSSFRALVDSETGKVIETWDRTIHEKIGHHDKEEALSLPLYQNSSVGAIIK